MRHAPRPQLHVCARATTIATSTTGTHTRPARAFPLASTILSTRMTLRTQNGGQIVHTDDAATKLSDRLRCFNCCTTDTSAWRCYNLSPGKGLCNKCGLFERTHTRPRPSSSRISAARSRPRLSARARPRTTSTGPRMSRYCVPASGGGPRRRERVAYVGVECGGRVHLLFSFHTFIISPSIPDVCPSCINTP
ncbi:hypothetical protein FB45DRAFT_904867 [Roridomyces roridus]|uniref:GATA-type domain-containing protein n=1 Tax=Roridomyces roridus TaxID=1738132 RepID=A0AAD7C580_9AGAR|nr:hypothetical protein FB45DRAFT_904867 [Roridomyces roridus]